MCGISGFLAADPLPAGHRRALDAMTDSLAHRGPDDRDTWVDEESGIGLGHRRLSIIDLSPEGRQPMLSASQRYVIVFNGEIYNYRQLGSELQQRGIAFRGHSDTEVMLAAVEQWGVEDALRRANGMFAIALWDRSDKRLHLARDRVGKKPLYYRTFGTQFACASELPALAALMAASSTRETRIRSREIRWFVTPRSGNMISRTRDNSCLSRLLEYSRRSMRRSSRNEAACAEKENDIIAAIVKGRFLRIFIVAVLAGTEIFDDPPFTL